MRLIIPFNFSINNIYSILYMIIEKTILYNLDVKYWDLYLKIIYNHNFRYQAT